MPKVLSRPKSQRGTAPVDNQELWTKMLNEIATKIAGSSTNIGVQTLFPFKMWDWGGKTPPLNSIPYEQQMFLDRVPLDPVANFLNAPNNFSSNYLQFIDQLNTQDPNDPKINQLYQILQDNLRKLNTVMNNAQSAYNNDRNRPEDQSFEDWLNKSRVFKAQVEQAELDHQMAQTNYNNYRSQKFNDIKRAVDKYDTNLLYITDPAGQSKEIAPWFIDKMPYDYVNEITGNNFGSNATKGNKFNFAIDSSTKEYDYKRVFGEANASFSLGFFSINVGGSYEKVDINTFESNWSISFQFQSFDQITVGTPDWYDSGVVQGRRNGPFRTGFSGYKDPSKRNDVWFFGQEGVLGRMMTTIAVGYRPKVVIKAGKKVTQYVKEKIEAGGSLQIGPFSFGGRGGSETVANYEFTSNGEIVVTSEGNWPYIVGLVSQPTTPSKTLNQRMLMANRMKGIAINSEMNIPSNGMTGYMHTHMRPTNQMLSNQASHNTMSPMMNTSMAAISVGVPAKQHLNFPPSPAPRMICLARSQPFGNASFVVYNSNNPTIVYGAGDCPTLTARPPYLSIPIPPNQAFTVQNLSPQTVEVSNC